uniref:NADH dehydrogenase subunit 6 n=1 Tax=Baldwinella vivanus TaxID=1311448 RepID=UPI0028FC97AD|nr:NADH dehydrogenase subunit 6 [Baldwinella vivanus]WNH37741.1 NADH dehydrogenase subunit 6 [Baldwinella vivanus]
MTYFMALFLFGMVVGLIAVASNPSPYFAALGLVVVSGLGCGALGGCGGPFLSLILFLIYLGGMLVVFAYSAALAAEPYPEGWGNRGVVGYTSFYSIMVVALYTISSGGWTMGDLVPGGGRDMYSVFRGDSGGVGTMYSLGGGMLMAGGGMLLLALVVVLELTRGLSRGSVRAV